MTEKPAQGVRGFILYCPITKDYVFRVYESEDKRTFTDYDLYHYDLEVEILDNYSSLYKDEEKGINKIDYPSHILHGPCDKQVPMKKSFPPE